MNDDFLFSPKGVNLIFSMVARTGALCGWMIIAVAHLALIQLLLALAWMFQITPHGVWTAVQQWNASKPGVLASVVGVSLLTLGWIYWKLITALHRTGGRSWLFAYITAGQFQKK